MTDAVRVAVGTGSPEGVNGAYVLPDAGVVIDPGPPGDEPWAALCAGIDDAGLVLADVDHVLVTHWHADHAGLSTRLAEAADARIAMHAADAPLVASYADERARRLERDADALRRWGVPETVRTALVEADRPSPLPDVYDVRELSDGDVVAGVEALATPGHTAGHAAFAYRDTPFLGDLLLPTYTPNVGGSDTRTDDPLAAYLRSVDRVDDAFDRGEPGHGTTVDVTREAASVREHHRERARRVVDALPAAGAATPWTVAKQLFGEMAGIHAKFGAGEASAHLRRLEAIGAVERCGDDPVEYRTRPGDHAVGSNLTP
ncbi:Glyoxylase, beta-lactamase superfamily II [Halorubrum aquaticum]|uniref:Glyoxylase, beta-lactamase superfamily II n=1 Tax=Halorubrum aquaticum TaxID=387340 RepID=A0A1I3A170_9EURY|nr:MBL fold metallo-hydrolase [Halorubrum aquaticum]SFH43857.1 Glyoxylase, beta-lactamase superfamily II [Halorubrum aquaticum]